MQIHEAEIERPNLKRAYTFGTDDTFNNPAGFSAYGQESTDQSTRRSMHDMRQSQPSLHMSGADGNGNGALHNDQSDDEQSENASSDEDEDEKPAKKRRQSKAGKDSTRNGKSRKTTAAEESSKKKRAAAQKLQRENLTEEQKRSNHILSEQKRRNLIKRGFDDLHDLVPEIRNGGLSKSAILTEAANFLEKVIQDNIAFKQRFAGG
jgi:cobalamin biosynthesis protein CobT